MPKAEVTTDEGLRIVVEGTTEEVAALLTCIKQKVHQNLHAESEKEPKRISKKKTMGDIIQELKAEGFFDTPKPLASVKEVMEQKGHFFRNEAISTTLIRQVKNGVLRRIKEDRQWLYVKGQ